MIYSKSLAILGLFAFVTLLWTQAANAQATRAPVPSKEQQQASQKLLDEAYSLGKTEPRTLIKRLMQEAAVDPNLPKDDLYVVLTTVIRLSQLLHDLPMMND